MIYITDAYSVVLLSPVSVLTISNNKYSITGQWGWETGDLFGVISEWRFTTSIAGLDTRSCNTILCYGMLEIKFMCDSCEFWVRWIPHNSIDVKSTSIDELAWCRQATNHYLCKYWANNLKVRFSWNKVRYLTILYTATCLQTKSLFNAFNLIWHCILCPWIKYMGVSCGHVRQFMQWKS